MYASAFNFQKSTEPPMNGSGFGSVVIIDEQRTTRGSADDVPFMSAATWFSTPMNSTAFSTVLLTPPPTPTAIATVSTPWKAGASVAGAVTSP